MQHPREANRSASAQAGAEAPQSQQAAAPSISLPKGGGAISGIGEKFSSNPATGTGSMSVPVATSPGRGGFGPQLALGYDSGSGNSAFGFGWNLSLSSITRKTSKGLPRYDDGDESDVFILAGAEDLVPVLEPGGERQRDCAGNPGYTVRRYRPRIEGLFARIERWTRDADGDTHWRVWSKDNVLTMYGLDEESRIAAGARGEPQRVFSWLISEARDDRGNAIRYRYKAEDGAGVDLGQAHQRNRGPRDAGSRGANRYPKRILYGNRVPLLVAGERPAALPDVDPDWMFEVVFDYGDHAPEAPGPRDDSARDAAGALLHPWPERPDAFSSYRAGFEVRSARLCRRVLMFHHFACEPEVGRDCLVRSTDLCHARQDAKDVHAAASYSFLQAVTHSAYRRCADGYARSSMPPLEFHYSKPVVQEQVEEVDADSLANLPVGLDGSAYRWADLHGEGVPGILTEQGGSWYYMRNTSPLAGRAQFAPLETVMLRPNASLGDGVQLLDLAGDGRPDVVVMDGAMPGLYEHDDGEGWQAFKPFRAPLNRPPRDPRLRFIDLDGDGRADVLLTEDDALLWHPSLGEDGFGPAQRVFPALDEEIGPRVVFADGGESIHLADLSGDGLSDIVRVRNGEVCYWPNLGYGRFGAKVSMDNPPWFDHAGRFDQRRIRLADIDGSGTTDIIYLHSEGVRLYFNQSGNAWSEPHRMQVFPRVDELVDIVPLDLLGNGTICLVWSSPLPADAGRPMRYVNLMGERKPHLLLRTDNNMGAETLLDYATSTRFYLRDKRDGKPWLTRLPFPVHVVERVETRDHIGRSRFVSRYAYHHGYFDGEEREFRGFGMVEQWDTEEFDTLAGGAPAADNIAAASHVAPIHTKTWFHTGAWPGRDRIADCFDAPPHARGRGEYFREPGLDEREARALLLPDTPLPAGLTLAEEREACRALAGVTLRREVYADDAAPGAAPWQQARACTPYSVTEQNFHVRLLQAAGCNRHAVFLTHANETLTYHYERNPADPRIGHALTLEVDAWGNVLKQAAIGYGRRREVRAVDSQGQPCRIANPGLACLDEADQDRQTGALLTYTENRFTNAVDSPGMRRSPQPAETITYELTGYPASGPAGRYQAADFVETAPTLRHRFTAPQVAYEDTASGCRRRRPVEVLRTLYRPDDLCGLLPLGEVQARALPGENYRLAFTPGLLAAVFRRPCGEALLPDPAALLGGQGGYVASQTLRQAGLFPACDDDGHWWVPSGRAFFSAGPDAGAPDELAQALGHFFLPRRYRDAFGYDTVVDFDRYDLLLRETRDALGNRVTVEANDYRVLKARLVSDPNRNQTEVAYDTLGMVAGSAIMGKPLPSPVEGDSLAGFAADLGDAQRDAFFGAADPHAMAPALLRDASTRVVYDLHRFRRSREAYPDDPARWQPAWSAILARETHASAPLPPQGLKIQLGFAYSDGAGREIQKKLQAEPGPLAEGGAIVDPRWVGSGWTIFNNKGKPVRQYEPFFSAAHAFEYGVRVGVSPVLFYDPAGRVVATLYPNHTYDKVLFDPWRQASYDVNDTCAARHARSGDPRTDPDVAGHMARHFTALGPEAADWRSWYAERIDGALGEHERAAAERAAAHADTPTTAHADALGRAVLTVAHNRVACPGHVLDGTEELIATRVDLDIEGRQRAARDERRVPVGHLPAGPVEQRLVMRYAYDMLGNTIHQSSMDAGARWMLNDVAGQPIRVWDSRGHEVRSTYDALRRPLGQTVRGGVAAGEAASDLRTLERATLVSRIEYGEPGPDATPAEEAQARRLNLRTRIYRHFDSAGVATNAALDADGNPTDAYDFKGNLLRSTRRLARDHTRLPDWSLPAQAQLASESFEAATRYDALNRHTQAIPPHSGMTRGRACHGIQVIQPHYNAANLLERVDVWLDHACEPAALLDPDQLPPSPVGIANVDYDAKGQRRRVDYKNGASTVRGYDPLTFRLRSLVTRRHGAAWPASELQNLHYTYDPAGNITHIDDAAQQAVYFRNRHVEAGNDYVYDALYRLIQAGGREHLGQQAAGARRAPAACEAFHAALDHPGDGNAMGTYIERYVYDAVGNLLQWQHRGSDPAHRGWTRTCDYLEHSPDEDGRAGPARTSNRLSRSTLDPNGAGQARAGAFRHDAHGNMVRMPHLGAGCDRQHMYWDYKDQLRQVELGGGGTAYYVYDASGQRVRKVWEKAPGLIEERIYFGGIEFFRKHAGPIGDDSVVLERETLHVLDGAQRLAMVETRTLDTAAADQAPRQSIRYQFANHLGTASLELDERAQIISYQEHSPYGCATYQAVRSQNETAQRYRFTGKERDEESGLYYHGARYYAPWLGRWTSCDPIGIADSINLYAYVRNNPVVNTDPTGMACDPTIATCIDAPGDDINFTAGEMRRVPFRLHVDEAEAVRGNLAGGVAGSPSDPANKQFLDSRTNVQSKNNFVSDAPRNARPNVSLADSPDDAANRILTGRFSEIDEVRALADDATANTRAGLRTNAGLRARMSASPVVRSALSRLGINPDTFTVENPPGVSQFSSASSVSFSPLDADVDPRTGLVVPGPKTSAAMERRAAAMPPPAVSAPAPAPAPVATPGASGPGMSGGTIRNAVGNVGVQLVPGAAEGIAATEILASTAASSGFPRLAAAAMSGAKAPGPAIVGGLVGAPAGYIVEGAARDAGLGEGASVAVGGAGAVATGALVAAGAVLLVATAPVSLTVLAGAAIAGGLAAGFGYFSSRAMQ
ncbi:SpvB/TcaC N-terminal domain-containing protein [Massilia atriviolacea]|uniref:SpvB/TcaC N-terminal domain-containing protein n=1 Tax=Massilia atriviolacea TaxID=2495579 RepID=UPI001E2A5695|nr:SpvB/TcaC N-terminal domain-containing protein [Massilia atriviolacea]